MFEIAGEENQITAGLVAVPASRMVGVGAVRSRNEAGEQMRIGVALSGSAVRGLTMIEWLMVRPV